MACLNFQPADCSGRGLFFHTNPKKKMQSHMQPPKDKKDLPIAGKFKLYISKAYLSPFQCSSLSRELGTMGNSGSPGQFDVLSY